jgi:hypothetical protein
MSMFVLQYVLKINTYFGAISVYSSPKLLKTQH